MSKKKFMETVKLGRGVTPKGIASWAFLETPQEDDNNREKYRITVIWNDSDLSDFKKQLKEWVTTTASHFKSKPAAVNVSLKTLDEEVVEKMNIDEVQAGMRSMEFNVIAKGEAKPIVVDSTKQPCDQPWAGDICRVQFNAVGYKTGSNVGVKLYLQGVQVVERNNMGGNRYAADLFDEEELKFDDDDSEAVNDMFGDADESNGDINDLGLE